MEAGQPSAQSGLIIPAPAAGFPPPNLSMKNSATPILLALFLLGGVVAGISWLMQSPTPAPAAVVAAAPPPKPAAPVALAPPPPEEPPAAEAPDDNAQQFQAMMQQRMQDMYGDVFSQMNLTPAQQAAVNDLMAQRFQAVGAIFRNAFQQGVDPAADPAQMRQQIDQAVAGPNQALHAALGDANYQLLQARDQEIRASFQNGGPPGAN
jgi:hypothetical protein